MIGAGALGAATVIVRVRVAVFLAMPECTAFGTDEPNKVKWLM